MVASHDFVHGTEMAPSIRVKVKFPSRDALRASSAFEAPNARRVLRNERRNYVSFDVSSFSLGLRNAPDEEAYFEVSRLAQEYDAVLVEDRQYRLEGELSELLMTVEAGATEATLSDVTMLIAADRAWEVSTGKGIVIAVVDTGVDGRHPEFPDWKRLAGWAVPGDDPWTDWEGHGTMCACIATGSSQRYRGVAPDAHLMPCKTHFFDSELAAIYDALAAMAAGGKTVVASNSFGIPSGTAPDPDPDSDFLPALDDAVAAGVIPVFSAGNYHQLADGHIDGCEPNSIWLHKGREDVITVATCDLEQRMWYYSSRGPGQHFGDEGTSRKPDITAPTPRNGRILYGAGERTLANGWGTSGACPQVAGLAALLVSAGSEASIEAIGTLVRDHAAALPHHEHCCGDGMIDCLATVNALSVA